MARILIIAPSWIGDTVMAQPLFRRLAERRPGVVIDVLAAPWVAPVLARMPEIQEVLASPFRHGDLRLRERWRLGRELARRNYDHAVVLPNTVKSALVPFFAGIPLRSGFVGEGRFGLLNLTHKLDVEALPSLPERYAQLAERPGVLLQRPLSAPELRADRVLRERTLARLGLSMTLPQAVLCPGAEYGPAKRWPTRHFAELARLLGRRGYAVLLVGAAKDRALGAEIAAMAAGDAHNLCGETRLDEAIDLIGGAALVVSNDSGLMHVAAALRRPLVAMFGSSSPLYTPPLSPVARTVYLGLPCSPCFERICPLGHTDCLEKLSPRQVLELIERLREESAEARP